MEEIKKKKLIKIWLVGFFAEFLYFKDVWKTFKLSSFEMHFLSSLSQNNFTTITLIDILKNTSCTKSDTFQFITKQFHWCNYHDCFFIFFQGSDCFKWLYFILKSIKKHFLVILWDMSEVFPPLNMFCLENNQF